MTKSELKLYQHNWYIKNKGRYADKNREWRKANSEKVKEAHKKWRRNNIERERTKSIMRYWPGASFEEVASNYKILKDKQNNLCAICKKPETIINRKANTIKPLSVDHCNKTGRVRGLLCSQRNTGIGNLRHCVHNLSSAITYLQEKDDEF